MEQWVEIAAKNGISILVVLAVGWFFYKKVWPLMEKRMNDADMKDTQNLQRWEDQRREHIERWERQGKLFADTLNHQQEQFARRFEDQAKIYAESLRSRDNLSVEAHRDQIKAYNQITAELKTLSSYIRNGGWGKGPPVINERK